MTNYNDENRKEDFNFFLQQYDELYKKYGKCFVAIKNKKILGIFHSEEEAIDITSSEYELGEFIIQECNGDESGYTNYITSWELISI